MERMKGGKPPPRVPAAKRSYAAFHDIQQLSASDPLGGAIINNRYEIAGRIGQGGMAHIYLAIDKETNSPVAVKILSDNPERSDELTDRFFVEARAAAKINHPNVIEIKDIGTYKDKTFCVMEYLEGRDLSTYLARREGLGWKRSANILGQVCDALEAAHEKGVIHRDMKPENIMLVMRGGIEQVKVLDFGLAKLTDSTEKLTRENIVLGTPTYMAPEQAWSRDYDKRVDIYALGVIGYEMLCGMPPFKSDIPDDKARTLQVLLMHREKPPQPPRERVPGLDIPDEAEAAILRALEKDPAKRFQSAGEMKEALLARPAKSASQSAPISRALFTQPDADAAEPRWEERNPPWSLPPEQKSFARSLGRAFKRIIIGSLVVAALAIPAYHYRDAISEFARDVKNRIFPGPGEEAQQQPEPITPIPPQNQTSGAYRAVIESTPRGATVFEISGSSGKRRSLGRTPLEITFQNWENELLVVKGGYYPIRIVVTGSEPEQRVTLRAIPRETESPGAGGNANPADSQEPGPDGNAGSPSLRE